MKVVLSLAILAMSTSVALAAPGDQWILGIHHINNIESFTKYTDAGYDGAQSSGHEDFVGDAYGRSGPDGVARVYWELSGNAINSGRMVPTSTELYTIEFYGTSAPGFDWQPVESQFHGIVGEGNHGIPPWQPTPSPAYDEHIPWVGQFSTNHQWIGGSTSAADAGEWNMMDNDGDGGPQAPFDEDFNAPGDGINMWLTSGSWLYAKWDFPFAINRSWSALRLTQITGVTPMPVDGDYNDDGMVDAADYVVWRDNVGSTMALPNDPIGGTIDQDQYNTWRANFGMMESGAGSGSQIGATNVPEPASIVLLISGLCASTILVRKCRSKRC